MDWSSLPLNFMSMGIFLIALKIQKGFNNKKKKNKVIIICGEKDKTKT